MIKPLLLSLLVTAVIAVPQSGNCRCRPEDSCWPSQKEWSALNNTIHGNLVAVRPVASVCHQAEYDAKACSTITGLWSDSAWRSSQPGAAQWENWEAWPERNQSCYVGSPQNAVCGQGRISLYSVKAHSASDIQQAVRFASAHNLRLVIKNTGHDFLGRSTAPESLQILTHGMTDVQIVDDFVPKRSVKSEGPAVTIAAGVQLPQMYAAVAKHNRTVIGGSSHTVGIRHILQITHG
ncbi:FAD-linked oxidoreductase [Penicillium canariense]|uniref:FAD-linked oxidoreductase n=1 Tax=Penicillium canariense TaxID=189055 RepID=A0A9W9I6R2_9EURO|nr:FAD-linked oxidoreductase [Penicillium canariense]KAJ5167689.1 FAD-linked oxidoreductase [Penicillium canariense]